MITLFQTPYFMFIVIAFILLAGAFSAYFMVRGVRKRRDEYWDRCLDILSAQEISAACRADWFTGKLTGKPTERSDHSQSEKRQLLRPSRLKREVESKGNSDYSHIIRSLNLNPEKTGLYALLAKIIGALIGGGAFWVSLKFDILPDFTDFELGAGVIVSLVAGSFLPNYLTKKIAQTMRDRIEDVAPDVVDLLLLSVEAGMSFDSALVETKSSLALYADELAKELEQLSAELVVLPNRFDAFKNLVDRTGSDTLRYLTVALAQGEKYGTPIAASLRTVAGESRKKRLIEMERQAGKLPVLMSIPLMVLILPPVIVTSAGPAFVTLMRSFGGGG